MVQVDIKVGPANARGFEDDFRGRCHGFWPSGGGNHTHV
jgi:hypothetical protein